MAFHILPFCAQRLACQDLLGQCQYWIEDGQNQILFLFQQRQHHIDTTWWLAFPWNDQ